MITNAEFIQGKGFVAEVIRTSRIKSAQLQVEAGAVSIAVPKRLSEERIKKLLVDKNRWIKEKLYLQKQAVPVPKRELVSGEAFPYLGRNYRLKVITGKMQPVKLTHGQLYVSLPKIMQHDHVIREMLVYWYQQQAELKFKEKVKRYAPVVGVAPKVVAVKTFKSRWGSCNAKGEILFHWKIIMAPHSIVDYIVVHELCHLKHHDHSQAFWKSVERVIPEYLDCKAWLRDVGTRFDI
jgi:predicted metal-dependent hydrolase